MEFKLYYKKPITNNTINLQDFENKIYSQNGEDGITLKLINCIYQNQNNKYFVEFGVENGTQCNTRILREMYGWNGLQMDGSNENSNINLKKEFITKENIVELFKKYNVPETINLLSVDIDYNDIYCLREILKSYKCDIIICEYNATHLANEDKIVIYDKDYCWDGTNYFGASLLSLQRLCNKYNYSLVYCCDMGVNCYFVHNDIIAKNNLMFTNMNDIIKLYKQPKYGAGPNGGHKQDPYYRQYITTEILFNEA